MNAKTSAELHKEVTEMAQAICLADFISQFAEATEQAHGGSWTACKGMTLEDAARLLAPNGFRIVFQESGHIRHHMRTAQTAVEAMALLPKKS